LPGTKTSERRSRLKRSSIVKGKSRAVSGCTITCAYFPGAKAGNALYVSGTLALDSAGNLVGNGDVKGADPAY
jgi:enamine deaminase RidA (YjgF/YER057c/UK114 family)